MQGTNQGRGPARQRSHRRAPRSDLGIAVVYQELLLFPELTVAENIFLGHAPYGSPGAASTGPAVRSPGAGDPRRRSTAPTSTSTPPSSTLSVANRQRVEIAKALSRNARLLIMDEPTAALAEADVQRLMDVVRKLRARGVAIIYVSHRMPEIFALSDRVTVIRDGALVGIAHQGDRRGHGSRVSSP